MYCHVSERSRIRWAVKRIEGVVKVAAADVTTKKPKQVVKAYLDVDLVATCLTHLLEEKFIGPTDGQLEHLNHVVAAAISIHLKVLR